MIIIIISNNVLDTVELSNTRQYQKMFLIYACKKSGWQFKKLSIVKRVTE